MRLLFSGLLLACFGACSGHIADPQRFVDVAQAFPCPKTPEETFNEIVTPKCATSGCHDTMSNAAGLDLQSADAADRLFALPSTCQSRLLLDDKTPFAGYLFEKITQTHPACGKPMPYGQAPLSAEEQACLHQWLWPSVEAATGNMDLPMMSAPTMMMTMMPGPPAPTMATAPSGVCPAPAAPGGALVLFDEAVAAGWQAGGFDWFRFTPNTMTFCSGSTSLHYAAMQYDGFQFVTDGTPAVKSTLRARINASNAATITVAVVPTGTTDPVPYQSADIALVQGWQTFNYAIPPTTTTVRWILFEKQDAGQTEIFIDDVRLE